MLLCGRHDLYDRTCVDIHVKIIGQGWLPAKLEGVIPSRAGVQCYGYKRPTETK